MTSEIRKEYKRFFNETEAGLYFRKEIERLISRNHESAEERPENSRDHTQRAKGNREVLEHIDSMMIEIKKGGRLK